jgi:CBS domain-containing protein
MYLKDLMSYPISSVKPDATVLDAINAMVSGRKGSVLVTREGLIKEAEGIVTTTEIFRKVLSAGKDPKEVKISEVMTPAPLVTVDLNASPREAADLMIKHNVRRLPVVEDGALVGIVTSNDLLRCVD